MTALQSTCATILRERSQRETVFPNLREAEWLMLLDLVATEARGRRLAIGDLQHSIFAPATTTLRHIGRLSRKGLIERIVDTEDKRRVFLSLTVLAREKLDRFAGAIADRSPTGGDAKQAPSRSDESGGAGTAIAQPLPPSTTVKTG